MSPINVTIRIAIADDDLVRKIEPRVAGSSERFQMIEELRSRGIYAGILLMSALPFIEDSEGNVLAIVRRIPSLYWQESFILPKATSQTVMLA